MNIFTKQKQTHRQYHGYQRGLWGLGGSGVDISFFLWLNSIPLCIYTTPSLSTYLSSDIQATSEFGYCKLYSYEHWGVSMFLNQSVLQIYAQEQDCWIIRQFYFQFAFFFFLFKEWLYHFPSCVWPVTQSFLTLCDPTD